MYMLYILGLLTLTISSDAYVFVQVRNGENQSNVDAVIHKVVPKSPAPEDTRKGNYPKRYEMLTRPKVDEGLESIVLAIDTGADPRARSPGKLDLVKKIQDIVVNFFRDDRVNAFFRSKDDFDVKPEIVRFKSGKPSLMLEMNFKSIMGGVKDLLKSRKLKQYTDNLVQKAALVYRALVDNEEEKLSESVEDF